MYKHMYSLYIKFYFHRQKNHRVSQIIIYFLSWKNIHLLGKKEYNVLFFFWQFHTWKTSCFFVVYSVFFFSCLNKFSQKKKRFARNSAYGLKKNHLVSHTFFQFSLIFLSQFHKWKTHPMMLYSLLQYDIWQIKSHFLFNFKKFS